jgi:hypothetical protein
MYFVNFPETSNASDWIGTLQLNDDETGDLIDLTGCTVTFMIVPQTFRGSGTGGLTYPNPNLSHSQPVLTASTSNGKITLPSLGIIQWTFRASEMETIAAGNYEAGLQIEKSPDTTQILLGKVPIINGGVY